MVLGAEGGRVERREKHIPRKKNNRKMLAKHVTLQNHSAIVKFRILNDLKG